MASTSHNELHQVDNLIFQTRIKEIIAEGEAEADEFNRLLHGRSSTPQEIEAEDDHENDGNAIIIATIVGTGLKNSWEIYAKSVFIRICREILRRGDNFTVTDFFNERYDDSLESLISSDLECFRRKFSRSFLVPAIFTGAREYCFFRVVGLLSKSTGKEIIGRYLKKRKKDECEDYMCPVCLDCLDQEGGTTMIATLDCGHEHHVDCIVSWLILKKNTCPLCRKRAIRDWKSGTMRFQRS